MSYNISVIVFETNTIAAQNNEGMARFCEKVISEDGKETITNIKPIFNVDRVVKHGVCKLLEVIPATPSKVPLTTEVIYLLLDDSFVFFTKDEDNVSSSFSLRTSKT